MRLARLRRILRMSRLKIVLRRLKKSRRIVDCSACGYPPAVRHDAFLLEKACFEETSLLRTP